MRWTEDGAEPGWTSALELARSREITLDGVTTRQALSGAETPAVILEDVDGATVRDCRALPGTSLFLSIRGAASRGVHLFGNDFSAAKRAYALEGGAREDAVEATANFPARIR